MPDQHKNIKLLGGEITLHIYDIQEEFAESLFAALEKEGIRLQRIFNLYDEKSELSQLNSKRQIKASPELSEVTKTALHYCKRTDGKYDITKATNYLERKAGKPLTKLGCSYKDIEISDGIIKLKHEDARIDLGSIAKGYIADKMLEKMRELGIESGYIDARGDIIIYGSHIEPVHIQHPRDKDKKLGAIRLKDMGVATSGDYKQFNESYNNSHIIADTDIISVTVAARRLIIADALATCIFVLGTEKARELLKEENASAMAIDENLKPHYYNQFELMLINEA